MYVGESGHDVGFEASTGDWAAVKVNKGDRWLKIMADLAKKKAEKCKKYAVFGKKWRKYLQIRQI